MARLKVGVIGCGAIAQIMHLPHLRRLAERYQIGALCDASPRVLQAVGDRYHIERRHTAYQDLLKEQIDAVLILTPGSHAAPAMA
ncbi:MAG: Gfo/Idh/MocA family oxidoreductase, partial [Anaerolineales bacterium]